MRSIILIFVCMLFLSKSVAQSYIYEGDTVYSYSDFKRCLQQQGDFSDIVYIYTSWCGPCRKKLPTLNEWKMQYANKPLRFWLVSADEIEGNWKIILSQTQTDWRQLWLNSDDIQNFKNQYYPFTIFPTILYKSSQGNIEFYGHDFKHLEKVLKTKIK